MAHNSPDRSFALKPVVRAIRRQSLASAGAIALVSGVAAAPMAAAQEGLTIEEVIVTAQKRDESAQDVPISIDVLGETQLEDLGVTDLEDFAQLLPSVSYVALGPGSGSIYIRGISGGGENVLGSSPNVAVYLDEQPITAVGGYLNPHIYDIARIEALAGPQGTLFGANSQSGSIRLITNKPNPAGFEASYAVEGSSIKSGDIGYLFEGMVNIPLSDRAALRLVGWHKEDAGFIDNVPYSHTFSNANVRAGLTDPALIAKAADITVDNADVVESDFNEATTTGARAALGIDLTDNWTVTASVMRQELEASGVWDHDPEEVGDLKVTRLLPDESDDEWTQVSLVVEGEISGFELTYAGSYLDRKSYATVDYSLYTDWYISGGFVQRFYSCYVAYFGECTDPREQSTYDDRVKRDNHEIRIASPQDQRFRALLGAFYEDSKHDFDWEWHVLGLNGLTSAFGTPAAVEPPDIYWTTDMVRGNEETAVFGEVAFDLAENFTAAFSMRWFESEVSLRGFYGTVWWPQRFGARAPGEENADLVTNNTKKVCRPIIVNQTGPGGLPSAGGEVCSDTRDTVIKGNLSWHVTDDIMLYGTYSEGYRPGGLNRDPSTVAGFGYDPDFVESWEVGVKASAMDGRARYNLAAFTMDWKDFQLSRQDTSISPATLTYNVGDARSRGIEGDLAYLLTENWDVSLAFSLIDAELRKDYWINRANIGDGNPDAAKGQSLPRVPDFKANVSTRYSFQLAEFDSYVQAYWVYTGSSYNSLVGSGATETRARKKQHAYDILNVAVGIEQGNWGVELFVRNITDERGEVFKNAFSYDSRITTNRPRTIGLRWRQEF